MSKLNCAPTSKDIDTAFTCMDTTLMKNVINAYNTHAEKNGLSLVYPNKIFKNE